jgi:CHASE3 domain sensor protein
MYMDLSDGAKALVDAAKLNGLVSSLDADLAAKCDQMIDAIGTVTLQSERAVQNARDYYDALPDSAKTLVTKLAVLEAAEKALAEAKQNAHLNPSVNTNQTAENNSSWIVIGVVAAVLVAAAGAVAFIVVRKKKSAKEE